MHHPIPHCRKSEARTTSLPFTPQHDCTRHAAPYFNFSWKTGSPAAWDHPHSFRRGGPGHVSPTRKPIPGVRPIPRFLHSITSRLHCGRGRQREIHSLSDANYLARAPYLLTNMGAYVLQQDGGTPSMSTVESNQPSQAVETLSGLISPEVFVVPIAIHGAGGVVETALAVNAFVKSAGQATGTSTLEHQRRCLLEARGRMERAFLYQNQPTSESEKNETDGLAKAAQDYWSQEQVMANTLQASQNLAEQVIDVFRHAIVAWTARVFTALKFALHATPWIGQVVACLGVAGAALQAVAGLLKWRSARKLVYAARLALAQWDARSSTATAVASRSRSLEHALCRRARASRCKKLKEAKAKRRRARVDTATGITTLTFLALSMAFPPLAIVAYQVMLLYVIYRVMESVTTAMDRRRSAQAKPAAWPDDEIVVQRTVQQLSSTDLPWLRPLLVRCGSSDAEIESLFQLVRLGELATAHRVLGNMVDGV